jgi:hypothetical protein
MSTSLLLYYCTDEKLSIREREAPRGASVLKLWIRNVRKMDILFISLVCLYKPGKMNYNSTDTSSLHNMSQVPH